MTAYRGWRISVNPNRPVTGTHVAERFGVTMCADNMELLRRMIDHRLRDCPWEGPPRPKGTDSDE